MGQVRDEEMFKEMDARDHGYGDGREEGEAIATALIADALGVDENVVSTLRSRHVTDKLGGLATIASTIEARVSDEQRRHALYTSTDPADVAKALIEDQTDPEAPSSGLHDPLGYTFEVNDQGVLTANSQLMPQMAYFEQAEVYGDWVRGRLDLLGFEREFPFCVAVADQLDQEMLTQAGENHA